MTSIIDHDSPIHPLLDDLIQKYKHFSQVEFPRGVPAPAANWKPLLQQLTQYEARSIGEVHKYLSGELAEPKNTICPPELKKQLEGFVTHDVAARDYVNKLNLYLKHIETIAHLLQDCAEQLGNPCQTFRSAETVGLSLKGK